jgi:FkbM family methyltransferase
MPQNVHFLVTCLQHMGYLGQAMVIHAALSSVPGSAAFLDGEMGREDVGLEHIPRGHAIKTEEVNVTTLDDLVQAEGFERIDHLTIDTEGNDVRVLLGALRTLASAKVRYLEFEYHQVGHWKISSLEDTIDMLDNLNFDCYWSLNGGGLRRLTGCWHTSYDERKWSNVACISRRERATHAYMERLAGF